MQADELSSFRRPRIRPAVIVLVGAGGLLLLVLLVALAFWISARRGLSAELERIRAAGEPASAAELEAFYQAPPTGRDTTQLWLEAIALLDTPQFQSDAKALPFVGEGAQEIPWPGELWPELEAAEALLLQYRRSLELMHQATREGGQARFPTRFADGYSMLLTHVQQLRGGARLLALESAVEAHRGRPDAAIDAIAAAGSLEQEPTLISQLVRIALSSMAQQRVAWLLSAVALDDAQLVRLDAELAASDYRRPLRRAMLGERVTGIEIFANPAALGDEQIAKLAIFSGSRDERLYLQLMGEIIAAADDTPWAAKQAVADVDDQLHQLGGSAISKLRYPLTMLLMPAIGACLEAASRNEAGRDATRAAIAIERFHRRRGRLPETLGELAPDLLTPAPIDPYDGAPLRYRIDPTEYVIYSVGTNGLDQGGVSDPPNQVDDLAVRVRRKDAAEPAAAQP